VKGERLAATFFRLVRTATPSLHDFLSYVELGLPLMDENPETRRLGEGISVNATLQQARNRANSVPSLRDLRYVAELHVPDDAPVNSKRTGRTRGHYTLWGNPVTLLGYVVSVWPVEPVDFIE
jgi:hypothetical protein